MSRILIEGFDHYAQTTAASNKYLPEYWDDGSYCSIQGVDYNENTITGIHSCSAITAEKTFSSTSQNFYCGFWIKFGEYYAGYTNSSTELIHLYTSGGRDFYISVKTTVEYTGYADIIVSV